MGGKNFFGQFCKSEVILHGGTSDHIYAKWGVGHDVPPSLSAGGIEPL